MDPGYVIMYHSNVTAIRQIEAYEAMKMRQPHYRLKVFFLLHAQTVEEQSYLTTLRREKQAFEFLIETKSVSILPRRTFSVFECFIISLNRKWLCRSIKMENLKIQC